MSTFISTNYQVREINYREVRWDPSHIKGITLTEEKKIRVQNINKGFSSNH